MRVQITTRANDVSQDERDRATELVQKLEKFDPNVLSADLVFAEEGMKKEIEARLSIARAEPVHATGTGGDYKTAADDLASKLSKILRRRRSQVRDRRARAAAGEESES